MDHLNQDETLLARWLAGELQEGDLEALRNMEGYTDYVEMLEALEGMTLPDFSPTLSWQALKGELGVHSPQSSVSSPQSSVHSPQSSVHSPQSSVGSEERSETSELASEPQSVVQQPLEENLENTEVEIKEPASVHSPQSSVGSEERSETPELASEPQSVVQQPLEENLENTEVEIKEPEEKEIAISAPQLSENQPDAATAQSPITDRQSPVIRRLIPWKMIAGVAAAVALLIVAIWWVSDGFGPPPMAETKAGEQKEVKLPDGSSVTLNALSSLSYSSEDWSNGRKVSLEGEAYFKAKKGKTFTVSTGQGSVEVVGTVFNVYARDNELEVKCSEGKVQVINPDASERALLKAGEQISVINGRMQKRHGLEYQPKWFKGESTFRSAPLDRVLDEMERQFGVVVLADSIEGRTYSGKFVHKDLGQALKMVCVPMKLKYSVSNDTVFIK